MRRTLEMTVIEGIKTSIPLHLKILADPDFVAGRLSTGVHGALPGREEAVDRQPRRSGVAWSDAWRRRFRRTVPLSDRSTPASARRAGCDPARARARVPRRRRTRAAAPVQDGLEPRLPRARRPAGARWPTPCGAPVIVNDRADIARIERGRRRPRRPGRSAAGRAARDVAGADAVVGLSTHDAGAGRRGAARAARPTSPSDRSSEPRPRTPATTRAGSSSSAYAVRPRASRSSRSAASRSSARHASSPPAPTGRGRHHRPADRRRSARRRPRRVSSRAISVGIAYNPRTFRCRLSMCATAASRGG